MSLTGMYDCGGTKSCPISNSLSKVVSSFLTDEEVSIVNAEGSFTKVLRAQRNNTSTELTSEPDKASQTKMASVCQPS